MKQLLSRVAVPLIAAMGLWLGSANGSATAQPASATAIQAGSESMSQPDTDSIQQGDQNSTDTPRARLVRASEGGSTEAENGGEAGDQSSDGPGGHQDPAGDVNHECTGDCQE